ncbi:hypothetical protein QIA36_00205 (plasmid) [Borreliella yangtzensis]|uniref:hypothetical protein n=1 Tax=Borreliella yangtzensis TaxID=683292 RepID=UPI0026475150|nr:hypothetical protein [Borreliella yangtzensis]WKC74774.1 hypothetical protein QIA36_00205 [Borreliella yangtzensis]
MLSINGVRLYSLKEFQNILEDSYNLSISKNTISKKSKILKCAIHVDNRPYLLEDFCTYFLMDFRRPKPITNSMKETIQLRIEQAKKLMNRKSTKHEIQIVSKHIGHIL